MDFPIKTKILNSNSVYQSMLRNEVNKAIAEGDIRYGSALGSTQNIEIKTLFNQ